MVWATDITAEIIREYETVVRESSSLFIKQKLNLVTDMKQEMYEEPLAILWGRGSD